MTDQEQALAWLREQMGEGWTLGFNLSNVVEDQTERRLWCARAWMGTYSTRAMVLAVSYGPSPMSAARACVEAWREATRREVMPCNCAELAAERQHANRLAEALADARAAYPMHCAHAVIDEALAAHDARRGEGR